MLKMYQNVPIDAKCNVVDHKIRFITDIIVIYCYHCATFTFACVVCVCTSCICTVCTVSDYRWGTESLSL